MEVAHSFLFAIQLIINKYIQFLNQLLLHYNLLCPIMKMYYLEIKLLFHYLYFKKRRLDQWSEILKCLIQWNSFQLVISIFYFNRFLTFQRNKISYFCIIVVDYYSLLGPGTNFDSHPFLILAQFELIPILHL